MTAANNEEIELKFSFTNGEALKDWLDHTFPVDAADDDWRTLQITDRYFDTPDEALKDAGFGARLRTVGADTLVTLKANLEVGDGLHRRIELEAPATRALNPSKWPDSEARAQLIDVVGARRLIERFAIGQQRRERAITFNGSTAMASLDEGEVEYLGIAAGELRHFEVELRDGDSAALRALARRVAASGLAKAEDRSKLELATDMVEQAGRVAPDDAWADAARKLLRRHLIRMLERESATRAGDVLALKQMRVATRRMRATWRVFGTAFAGRHARDFDVSLRRVAGLLGAVRDLDVLLETVEKRDEVATMSGGLAGAPRRRVRRADARPRQPRLRGVRRRLPGGHERARLLGARQAWPSDDRRARARQPGARAATDAGSRSNRHWLERGRGLAQPAHRGQAHALLARGVSRRPRRARGDGLHRAAERRSRTTWAK